MKKTLKTLSLALIGLFIIIATASSTSSVKNSVISAPAAYGYYLNMPRFKQENSYYCGPATTKQTLHCRMGWSESQSYYAARIGTTTSGTYDSKMVEYINSVLPENPLWTFRLETIDHMNGKILNAMLYFGNPTIIPVRIPQWKVNIGLWPYATNGHVMNISGIDYPYMYRIVDPAGSAWNNGVYSRPDVEIYWAIWDCNKVFYC